MYPFGLYQYNMVHTGIYQDETFPFVYKLVCSNFVPGGERFKSSSCWYISVHPQFTWFTLAPCWAVLASVKAAELQRPKGTPIQTETIYCLSTADALVRQRPAGAAEELVH
jgi:hypothetical protein